MVAKHIKLALVKDLIANNKNSHLRAQQLSRILFMLFADAYKADKSVLAADIFAHIEQSIYEFISNSGTATRSLGVELFETLITRTALRSSSDDSALYLAQKVWGSNGPIPQIFLTAMATKDVEMCKSMYETYKNSLNTILMGSNWDLIVSASNTHYYLGRLFDENPDTAPINEYVGGTITHISTLLSRANNPGAQQDIEEAIHFLLGGLTAHKDWMLKKTDTAYIYYLVDLLNDILDLPPKTILQSVLINSINAMIFDLSLMTPDSDKINVYRRTWAKTILLALRTFRILRRDKRVHVDTVKHDLAQLVILIATAKNSHATEVALSVLPAQIRLCLEASSGWTHINKEDFYFLFFSIGIYLYIHGKSNFAILVGKELLKFIGPGLDVNLDELQVFLKMFQIDVTIDDLKKISTDYRNELTKHAA